MSEESFIQKVFAKARQQDKTIVLPEGSDPRVLEAANTVNSEKIARVILVGNKDDIAGYFAEKGYTLDGIRIEDPENSPLTEQFANTLFELRKSKGMTEAEAATTVRKFNYFGTMMVHAGLADGLVSGAIQSTADTVRPALQIIRSAKKGQSVSSFFVMCVDNEPYLFSDCALIQDPTASELATIALQSAHSALSLDIPAQVAMLSYSTYGSAESPQVDKVKQATELALKLKKEECPELPIYIDGELQLDAAIVPKVAAKKCPDSDVAGKARVLVFPDLNAGNIGYKLVQRLGGADAYGPVLQGLNKPVNDLSRGCSAEDIVGVVGLTVLQASAK